MPVCTSTRRQLIGQVQFAARSWRKYIPFTLAKKSQIPVQGGFRHNFVAIR